MPSKVLNFATPLQKFTEIFPNSRLQSTLPIKTFGCTIFIHNKDLYQGKLDPKGTKCVFLGYSPNQKGYKCYDPRKKKYFVPFDIQFFENHSYFQPHLQGEKKFEERKILFKGIHFSLMNNFLLKLPYILGIFYHFLMELKILLGMGLI